MKRSSLPKLRCPACKRELELEAHGEGEIIEGELTCQCGQSYPIQNGTPNFIYPDQLLPSDEMSQKDYEIMFKGYDTYMEWLFKILDEDEDAVRSQMTELLGVESGSCVLEVGCGTGSDSIHIIQRIQPRGELYAQELSPAMLEIAKSKLAGSQTSVEYSLGNASYLPFADDIFDAVFHFGGVNTFGDKAEAMSEMTRVVRTGGKVVIGDESVSPWLRRKTFGKILMKYNPLYKYQVPLKYIPENAREVCLRWILGNAFYLIDYRVGNGPPKLDIDSPIPFKGDTIRSRYYGNRTNK
jgi:ubiquinone/menaquinone biosynthesis C-methylase UbiE